jgi:predicted lipid-binding transport protein (Tim44 family)
LERQPGSDFDRSSPLAAHGAGALPAAKAAAVPAGFDVAGFLKAAKQNFIRLQDANDRGDLDALREMTTKELFATLAADVAGRGASPQLTDVKALEAELLEVLTEGEHHRASLHFRGLIRETADTPAESFEEIWNLEKPVSGDTGWLLAGIQQLR